jgi:hypothetical protein
MSASAAAIRTIRHSGSCVVQAASPGTGPGGAAASIYSRDREAAELAFAQYFAGQNVYIAETRVSG